MKHIPSLFVSLLFLLVFTSCGGEESSDSGNGSGQDSTANQVDETPSTGSVSGTINFSGKPCKPEDADYSVPPCSGPWPNKEVEIFKSDDTSSPLKTVTTDAEGKFSADLSVGEYVIFTQDGTDPEDQAENTFDVKGGKNTEMDLTINTGVE